MIFGGLLLFDIIDQTPAFDLQVRLYEEWVTDGVQVLVPSLLQTPGVSARSIRKIMARLPKGMRVFIHYAAESRGVDLACCLDERGVARALIEKELSWAAINKHALEWGNVVRQSCVDPFAFGVVHCGYTLNVKEPIPAPDEFYRQRSILSLRTINVPVVVENLPGFMFRENQPAEYGKHWDAACYLGLASTPECMRRHLSLMPAGSQCLIDFTHLAVVVNQVAQGMHGDYPDPSCRTIDDAVAAMMQLPHCNVCHFSGMPPGVVDDHEHLAADIPECVIEALREHDVICIESRWTEDLVPSVNRLRQLIS